MNDYYGPNMLFLEKDRGYHTEIYYIARKLTNNKASMVEMNNTFNLIHRG